MIEKLEQLLGKKIQGNLEPYIDSFDIINEIYALFEGCVDNYKFSLSLLELYSGSNLLLLYNSNYYSQLRPEELKILSNFLIIGSDEGKGVFLAPVNNEYSKIYYWGGDDIFDPTGNNLDSFIVADSLLDFLQQINSQSPHPKLEYVIKQLKLY